MTRLWETLDYTKSHQVRSLIALIQVPNLEPSMKQILNNCVECMGFTAVHKEAEKSEQLKHRPIVSEGLESCLHSAGRPG